MGLKPPKKLSKRQRKYLEDHDDEIETIDEDSFWGRIIGEETTKWQRFKLVEKLTEMQFSNFAKNLLFELDPVLYPDDFRNFDIIESSNQLKKEYRPLKRLLEVFKKNLKFNSRDLKNFSYRIQRFLYGRTDPTTYFLDSIYYDLAEAMLNKVEKYKLCLNFQKSHELKYRLNKNCKVIIKREKKHDNYHWENKKTCSKGCTQQLDYWKPEHVGNRRAKSKAEMRKTRKLYYRYGVNSKK